MDEEDSGMRGEAIKTPLINSHAVKVALLSLLIVYCSGTLCLQAFNTIFAAVGASLHAGSAASLIGAVPEIILGISCFIYGALGDFVSLRKMMLFGVAALALGSVGGFFWHGSLPLVILWRCLQTLGYQATGSIFTVMCSKYLSGRTKVLYFGFFGAAYDASAALGVLASGAFASSWPWLFLLPAFATLTLPLLARVLPDARGIGGKVDVFGFTLFSTAILFLTLFFNQLMWWEIALATVLFVAFGMHIHRAENPLMPPAFFRNRRWLAALMLMFFAYFTQFCYTPVVEQIGEKLFGLSPWGCSMLMMPAFVVSFTVSLPSGAITAAIGRRAAVFVAFACQGIGAVAMALFGMRGPVPLAAGMCVLYIGYALAYAPVYDSILATVPVSQSGRAVGMNDLVMEGCGAIGIAIFGSSITGTTFAGARLVPVGDFGAAALRPAAAAIATNLASLLLIYAAIQAVAIVWVLVFAKLIYGQNMKEGSGVSPAGGAEKIGSVANAKE